MVSGARKTLKVEAEEQDRAVTTMRNGLRPNLSASAPETGVIAAKNRIAMSCSTRKLR